MRDCTDEIGQDPFAAQCTAALVEYNNSMWHQKKIVPRRKNLVQAVTLVVRDLGETFNVQLRVHQVAHHGILRRILWVSGPA